MAPFDLLPLNFRLTINRNAAEKLGIFIHLLLTTTLSFLMNNLLNKWYLRKDNGLEVQGLAEAEKSIWPMVRFPWP